MSPQSKTVLHYLQNISLWSLSIILCGIINTHGCSVDVWRNCAFESTLWNLSNVGTYVYSTGAFTNDDISSWKIYSLPGELCCAEFYKHGGYIPPSDYCQCASNGAEASQYCLAIELSPALYYLNDQISQIVISDTMCTTKDPTPSPTPSPTTLPTPSPTSFPTPAPTTNPSKHPTFNPTNNPTTDPTFDPTTDPTIDPTFDPTLDPTSDPTNYPSTNPTIDPTKDPTLDPTHDPTMEPSTANPTMEPTYDPTFEPTIDPTKRPSYILEFQFPTYSPSSVEITTGVTEIITSFEDTYDGNKAVNEPVETMDFVGLNIKSFLLITVILLLLICIVIIVYILIMRRRKKILKMNMNTLVHNKMGSVVSKSETGNSEECNANIGQHIVSVTEMITMGGDMETLGVDIETVCGNTIDQGNGYENNGENRVNNEELDVDENEYEEGSDDDEDDGLWDAGNNITSNGGGDLEHVITQGNDANIETSGNM